MRLLPALIIIMIAVNPALADVITHFSSGGESHEVNLPDTDRVSFSIPTDGVLLDASVSATGRPDASGLYPDNVTLMLNDTPLWGYGSGDYGSWGLQRSFLDGITEVNACVQDNGSLEATTYLHGDAVVEKAELELNASPSKLHEVMDIYAFDQDYWVPPHIDTAGDLNGDGHDDIAIGSGDSVRIYFGGDDMNITPDLVLKYTRNPIPEGTGDFNGDGYDDLVVADDQAYRAELYLGGPGFDNVSDLVFDFEPHMVGDIVSVGDINDDGLSDLAIAMADWYSYPPVGPVMIYFGNATPDNVSDLTLTDFGSSTVAGGMDVNGDEVDDFIVGNITTGKVYLFFGGSSADAVPDLVFEGPSYYLGLYSTMAGDLNHDGYADVALAGVNKTLIYFGGANMDNSSDVNLNVSMFQHWMIPYEIGDINNDGYEDLGVSLEVAFQGPTTSNDTFLVYLGGPQMDGVVDAHYQYPEDYNYVWWVRAERFDDINGDGLNETGVLFAANGVDLYLLSWDTDPTFELTVNNISAWSGSFNGTRMVDLAAAFPAALQAGSSVGDDWGNRMVELNFTLRSERPTFLSFGNLTIRYNLTVKLNLTDGLRAMLLNATGDELLCNLTVISNGTGAVNFSGLRVVLDRPPDFFRDLVFYVDEGSTAGYDLRQWVADDFTSWGKLNLSLGPCNGTPWVDATLSDEGCLELNSTYDVNWSGVAGCVLTVTDEQGLLNRSWITIIINNTEDAPVITSQPNRYVTVGSTFEYIVEAVDGDDDPLEYRLDAAPAGMKISRTLVQWTPTRSDLLKVYNVTVNVSDGQLSALQSFTLTVFGTNVPPQIISTPPVNVTLGERFIYTVRVIDTDGDPVNVSLVAAPPNMTLGPVNLTITWFPTAAGRYPVSVKAADPFSATYQNFSVEVVEKVRVNHPPVVAPLSDVKLQVGELLSLHVVCYDPDEDALCITVKSGPPGMSVVNGNLTWMPSASDVGNHTVLVSVSDGNLSATASFRITVRPKPVIAPHTTSEAPPYFLLILIPAVMVIPVVVYLRYGKKQAQKPARFSVRAPRPSKAHRRARSQRHHGK